MIRIFKRTSLTLSNNNKLNLASEKPKKKVQTVGFSHNNIESIKYGLPNIETWVLS